MSVSHRKEQSMSTDKRGLHRHPEGKVNINAQWKQRTMSVQCTEPGMRQLPLPWAFYYKLLAWHLMH